MLTFETGVQVGQALAQLKDHGHRLQKIEAGHSALSEEVHSLKALVTRGGLLIMLWGAGIAGNVPADRIGETLGAFLKAFSK